MDNLKVIYMSGGADFTLPPLKVLIESSKLNLLSTYTKTSRPAGRVKKIQDTTILEYLKNHNID